MAAQRLAPRDRRVDRERVEDVNAREHIGGGIGALNHPDQMLKEAVCGVRRDAEVGAVRKKCAD